MPPHQQNFYSRLALTLFVYLAFIYYIYILSLLMPKIIPPRRTNKNISAEEYWDIRQNFTKKVEQKPIFYQQHEVKTRHRYSKPTQEAQSFNPLQYFMEKQFKAEIGQTSTHTQSYLESIHYRLPQSISHVKHYMYGLASIVKYLPKIYEILWNNLNLDDSWKLLQALIQDTKGQCYDLWLQVGFQKIVNNFDLNFNANRFKNLFLTLCIFMETFFHLITANQHTLHNYYKYYLGFLTHHNKYIRKFSMESCSYILTNISDQIFQSLVQLIKHDQDLDKYICQFFVHRIKYTKGCLTPQSLQEVVERIKWLSANELSHTQLISSILNNLKNRTEETQLLYDLGDLIKVIAELSTEGFVPITSILEAIYSFQETQSLKKRKGERTALTTDSYQYLSNLTSSKFDELTHSHKIYTIIMRLFQHCPSTFKPTISSFITFISTDKNSKNIMILLQETTGIDEDLLLSIIFGLRQWVNDFITLNIQTIDRQGLTIVEIVYRITLILKDKNKTLECTKLSITNKDIVKQIKSIISSFQGFMREEDRYMYCLVFVRLLSFIVLQDDATIVKQVQKLYKLAVFDQYQENLADKLHQSSSDSLYDGNNFIQQIFTYAHENTSGWILRAFNMFEAFAHLQPKFKTNCKIIESSKNYEIWPRILMNRMSLVSLLYNQISLESSYLKNALQSRHREIRLTILQNMNKMNFSETQMKILSFMIEIDNDTIDLQTQRQIKRIFLSFSKHLQTTQQSQRICQIVMCWSLGFAFTGFKLITQSFQEFLGIFLQKNALIVETILMKFLQYYNFKNSRIFQIEMQRIMKISQEHNQLPCTFSNLMKEDFIIQELVSVEFIGLERITSTIQNSKKIKKLLQKPLSQLINCYFDQQFNRHRKTLQKVCQTQQQPSFPSLLQPPKTNFLKQILKIVPQSCAVPVQCLHYTENYLQLSSIKKIKRHNWELLWQKKKKKQEMTNIEFDKLTIQEQELYVHYLWGHILPANTGERRKIIQHIRDHLPHMVQYLINIFYSSWLLKDVPIKNQLKMMNYKQFLMNLYILKSMLHLLKNYMDIEKVITIVIESMNIIHGDHEQIQIEEQSSQQEQQSLKKYKNHRKQTYKILLLIMEHYHQEVTSLQFNDILHSLSNKFSTLVQAAQQSIPGLLLFIGKASQHSKFHSIISNYRLLDVVGQMFANGKVAQQFKVIECCCEIVFNVLRIDSLQEKQISIETNNLLDSTYTWISTADKASISLQIKVLKIIKCLISEVEEVKKQWQAYLWKQISKLEKRKNQTEKNQQKLLLILEVCALYGHKTHNKSFIFEMITLLPHFRHYQHKLIINKVVHDAIIEGKMPQMTQNIINIVHKINSSNNVGLTVEMNFVDFFNGIKQYETKINSLSSREHQYFIYNLITYLHSEEMSVRKSVSNTVGRYLQATPLQQKQSVARITRNISNSFRTIQNDTYFWSNLNCLGHFVRWITNNDGSQNYDLWKGIVNENDNDVFGRLCSLSQSDKMKGLRSIQDKLNLKGQMTMKMGYKYPHILTGILIPILQHLIMPIHDSHYEGNLTSTLSHISLQIYGEVLLRGGPSLQKKQMKRLISKLKFDDSQKKKNILLIKMISQIIDQIDLPKSTQIIKTNIKEHGFQKFHQSIVQKESKFMNIRQNEEDSDDQGMNKALTKINNEMDDDEAINLNYLTFDKKIIQAEYNDQEPQLIRFLRIHILTPLKTMLMYENKSSKDSKDQTQKSRLLISVTLTKLIIKFPVDVFISEFQKIITKLAKLLKNKQLDVRENSRKCLSQISKTVGPQMLYLICRQLKFHLRDNFQQHIFNYTMSYIVDNLPTLETGSLDHCLPVLLPLIMDEIYGKSAKEKDMVNEHEIPTINMESRKKKGNQLFLSLCQQISIDKISYLIKYIRKFLKDYLNSENNLTKYEQMLNNVAGGLGRNKLFMNGQPQNIVKIINFLEESLSEMKNEVKFYRFEDQEIKHDSIVSQRSFKPKKAGSKQAFQLQEEVGRNGSIFKKQTKSLLQRRNTQILTNCYMQFYLTILTLLVKKKVITEDHLKELQADYSSQSKFKTIINFLIDCLHHRENRIVVRCLKILYPIMRWKKLNDISTNVKKIYQKLMKLVLQETGGDEELQKQALIAFNQAVTNIQFKQKQDLLNMIEIIKISISSNEQNLIDEPYRLFLTVMFKISSTPFITLLEVVNLYNQIKFTMLSTTNDKIRNVCRDICRIFMRSEHPQTKSKKQSKIKKQQLSFYLNNIDCHRYEARQCIFQIISQYVENSEESQLLQTGEVIIMTFGTAYANQQGENQQKMKQIILLIASKLNKAKVLSIVQKCLVWISNQQNILISICGAFLLKVFLSQSSFVVPQSIFEGILSRCLVILRNESENLLEYIRDRKIQQKNKQKTIKENPEWENLLIDQQAQQLKQSKLMRHIVHVFNHLLLTHDKKFYEKQSNGLVMPIVQCLWILLLWPEWECLKMVKQLLMKFNKIVQFIGVGTIISVEKEERKSLINVMLSILNNRADNHKTAEYQKQSTEIGQLFEKVLLQINGFQLIDKELFFSTCLQCLFTKLNKSFINLQKYEGSLAIILEMMKKLISFDSKLRDKVLGIDCKDKTNVLFKDLLWNIAKIRRNQQIGEGVKEKNEELGEMMGELVGRDELLRMLAFVQAERSQNKRKQKIEIARLAVTDQVAFQRAKAKKKRKL